jgi:NTE family protein
MKEHQLGIVLSGGGVRGIAHIGLLKALEEHDIRPQVIAGSSAGALVGALYAYGHDFDAMLHFFKKVPLFKFSFYSAVKPGLLDIDKYRVFFKDYFPENDFSALKKKLYVATTDLASAKSVYFNEGPLIDPLLASAALPPLFTPVDINGRYHGDGGIMNNFPVEPIEEECELIIGSHVNPVKKMSNEYFTNTVRVLLRAVDLRFYAEALSKTKKCIYNFEPTELFDYNMLDVKNIDRVFEIGYQAAVEEIELIKEKIA